MTYIIKPGISIQDAGNEAIVLDKEGQKVHQLNPVATFIWHRISQREPNIPELICDHFDIDLNTAKQDYNNLIDLLITRGLIINDNEQT